MNLFGKKKPAAPKPTTESAIHQLNESIATIDKREQHLTSRIDALHKEAAVKLKKNDKKGALNIMKRAKMLEADVNKLQGTRQNLELQISTLESAAMNARVVDSFKASTTALKNINGGMDADQAFDIMDEMKEAKDMAKELQDVISEVPTEYEYEDVGLYTLQIIQQLTCFVLRMSCSASCKIWSWSRRQPRHKPSLLANRPHSNQFSTSPMHQRHKSRFHKANQRRSPKMKLPCVNFRPA